MGENTNEKAMELEINSENDRKRRRYEEHLEVNVKVEKDVDKILKMKVQSDEAIADLKNKIEMREKDNKKLQYCLEKEQLNYQQLKLEYQELLMLEESNLHKISGISKIMSNFLDQIKNMKNFYKMYQNNQDISKERREHTIKLMDEIKSKHQYIETEYAANVASLHERLEDKNAVITVLNDKVVSLNINITFLEDKVKELQNVADNLQSANTGLNDHKQKLKEEVAMWMQKCDRLKEEGKKAMLQLNVNLQEFERQCKVKCDELQNICDELNSMNDLKTKLICENDNLKEELRDRENYYIEQKSTYKTKLTDIKNEVKELCEDFETTVAELESQKTTLQQQIEMLQNDNKNTMEQIILIENQLTDSAEELRKIITDKENLEVSMQKLQLDYETKQIKWHEDCENLNKVHSENIKVLEAKESEFVKRIKELQNQILIRNEEYEHVAHNCKLLSMTVSKPKAIKKKRFVKDAKVVASPQVGCSSTDQSQKNLQETKNYVQEHVVHDYKLRSTTARKPIAIKKKRFVKDAKVVASPQIGCSSTDQTQKNLQETKNYVQEHVVHDYKLRSTTARKPIAIKKKRFVKDAKVVASPQIGCSSTDQTQKNLQKTKNYVQYITTTRK